jgi:PilZ domain
MSHPTASENPRDVAVGYLAERRFVPRHQTSKVAKIILHQGRSGIVCTISNISPAGALLLVGNAHDLPEQFDLQMDGYSRRCVATWRRPDRIGVQFKSVAAS